MLATRPADSLFRHRADVQRAVVATCEPLIARLSDGRARARLEGPAASYSRTVQEMEGFCRLLWGLAPLLAGGGGRRYAALCRQGLTNGTNPRHPEYWGAAGDRDQRFVECAAIAVAVLMAPEALWQPLSGVERRQVAAFLGTINRRVLRENNWLFFRVLVNAALASQGAPYDRRRLQADLRRIDSFYLGGGWYADGRNGAVDYYGPWALHFYGLMFAAYASDLGPQHAIRFRERAGEFAGEFIHWFAPDGAAIPYGRSLTYRFAQAAFWAALPLGGVTACPWGLVKGMLLRHLRWWFSRPIWSEAGLLTVGYGYPNHGIGEAYNSPCSPYWALKSFAPLALAAHHPFWTTAEEELPTLPALTVQRQPAMLIGRAGGQVIAFTAARSVPTQHRHAAEKYSKFCYSTLSGFGAARSPSAQCGYDSMLALRLSAGDQRVRRESRRVRVTAAAVVAQWSPWPDVQITTWLIPVLPWHVRVHRVRSRRPLSAVEGGFSLGLGPDEDLDPRDGAGSQAVLEVTGGRSAIVALHGRRRGRVAVEDPGTNLLHERSAVPLLTSEHRAGVSWLASAVVAVAGTSTVGAPPRFRRRGNAFTVTTADGTVVFRRRVGDRSTGPSPSTTPMEYP